MPFVLLRGLDARVPETHPVLHRLSALGDSSWSRKRISPFDWIFLREPSRAWRLSVEGRPCWVILEGNTVRPRRVDASLSDRGSSELAELVLRDGLAAPDRIEGHYVLAVVDAAGSGITVVRDRLGGRVAYWGRLENLVAVSDRAEIVAEVVGSRTEEDPCFLAHFFAPKGGAPVGHSAFRGVNELVPGGSLTIDGRVLKEGRKPFSLPEEMALSPAQWIEAFYEAFRTAVSDAVGSHESIAVMLSGGMDSAPIMAVAREILDQQNRRLVAVSWALPGYPASDESRWIIEASDFARVERRMFRADELLPFSSLGANLVLPGSPALNPFRSMINACYHSAAAAGCSVVLNGSRGDVLYSNYPYLLYDLIRRRDFPNLWRELGGLIARSSLRSTFHNPMVRYAVSRLINRTPRKPPSPGWLTPWACSHLDTDTSWPPESKDHPFPGYAAALLGPAMTYGPAQENEFAQRFDIERREPFQSASLVRLMLAAPVLMSHRGGLSKWVMRQAMAGKLPASVRLKPRTGLLDEIYRKGFIDHREKIRQVLCGPASDSPHRYIRTRAPIPQTSAQAGPVPAGVLLATQCLGYLYWQQHNVAAGR